MSKVVKEIVSNPFTGEVSVEYSDDSTNKFNVADTVTAVTNDVTGGIEKVTAGVDATALMLTLQKLGRSPLYASILGNSIAEDQTGIWSAILASRPGMFLGVKNGGVGGNRTADMLARVGTDIVAPTQVCFVIEGTNDAFAIGNATLTLAQHCDNMRGILSNLISRGILPVVLLGCPRISTPAAALLVRASDYKLASDYGVPVFDPFAACIDPATGLFKSGMSDDGIHPNATGVAAAASEFARQIADSDGASLRPKANIEAGIFRNNLFLTDTNADGLAEYYSRSGTGMTRTLSDASSDGVLGNWQNFSATTGFQYLQSELRDLPRTSLGEEADRLILFAAAKYTNTAGCRHRLYVEFYAANGSTSLGGWQMYQDVTKSFGARRFVATRIPPVGAVKVRFNVSLNHITAGVDYDASGAVGEMQMYNLAALAGQI